MDPLNRTLIDSTPGVLKAWEIFCKDYGLGDPTEIAHLAHGRRMYDTLTEFCHIDDEVKLEVCDPFVQEAHDMCGIHDVHVCRSQGRNCAV